MQHMLHEVARHLEAGEIVAVFPEGTTSDGLALLPFHGNLMQAAIHVDCPIQPVAIRFLDLQGLRSEAPLFIGETTFVESAWNILGAPGVIAELHWLEPIAAAPDKRRSELSDLARERIAQALSLPLSR
ncbi:MAG: 1-acyl-sn-glycerol-3-phosphate acyltransferase [Burkholderiaceae bacterium]